MREVGRVRTDDVTDAGIDAATVVGAARLRAVIEGCVDCRYSFHVDFAAVDDATARGLAVVMAEALGLLRIEVDTYSARLSFGTEGPVEVFCTADGPGGAFCGRPSGHGGWHVEPGVGGERWGDGDATGTVA
jgi:hypothetical protein